MARRVGWEPWFPRFVASRSGGVTGPMNVGVASDLPRPRCPAYAAERARGVEVKLLTVKQAAEAAGVSDSLVYEWCSEKLLPHYRFGTKGKRGKVMIDEKDLDAFLAS